MNTYPYELTDKGLFSFTHCYEWVKWVSYVRVISCTRVRYCRGKMLIFFSLHVLELKNKRRGVFVCPMMVHAIASFNVPMIWKSLLSKRFNFSPLFYWMVNNSFVSRLFVQSWVFHSRIYPPVIVEIN
jgi:hypothetical protein